MAKSVAFGGSDFSQHQEKRPTICRYKADSGYESFNPRCQNGNSRLTNESFNL
jgi:hypothetical protein